ncbi:LysR family transcriptional regulator [Candidatus Stoquefichus massiliensis]|uniref:LysR family transcriptional regulator n=1 Tax=Candidatus Stoquefichus massiliensis TaxID=1470350 RepID=UPI000486F304|nr:LysR family transcriptional regulator [Candidatus Stoquefichus massiliensis]
MKKEQLRNFIEVVDCGSINKAAEKLYISQPNLSRSIHALEEEMGKELLKRTNRGVTLTPTGQLLYYYARSILNQFQVLERLKNLSEEVLHRKLSVSVDSIFLKDDFILEFYKYMDSAETEIHIIETTAEEVLDNVSNIKSELGITILNDYQLNIFKKMADAKEVSIHILGQGPLYVHVNEKHPLALKEIIDAEELCIYPYIHLPNDFFSNLNQSLTINKTPLSSFQKNIVMSNYHAMINMINHTDSFMLGNKWQVEELKYSHIKSIPLKNCNIHKNFVIIKRKREILSDAGNTFLNIIKNTYEQM